MRSRLRRDERGAFLLIFALCLTVILIIVAMTVDLGQARFSKRDEQQLADLASLSAGRQMAGYGITAGGTVVSRPRDACTAAMASIRTNSADFAPSDSEIATACGLLPATTAGCTAATAPINATVVHEPYAVTARWPIPPDEIRDPRFAGTGEGADDGADQCQRMRIAVQRTDDTAFGGVIGVGSLTTTASAVIRSTLDNDNKVIPAFLILERSGCEALSNSSNGVDSFGVQILGIPSTDQPGTIHVDSTADSGCNGNAANSVAVYGKSLSGGGPSIMLHPAPLTGTPGQLYVVATSNAAKDVPSGVNVPPQPADVVSRSPLDEEFDSPTNPAVTKVHDRARTALSTTITTDVSTDGWRRLGCNLNALSAVDTDRANWYVECSKYTASTGQLAAAAVLLGQIPDRVVFAGDIEVANGQTLTFAPTLIDGVKEVAVKGKIQSAGTLHFGTFMQGVYVGGGDYTNSYKTWSALNISGQLQLRTNGLPTLDATGKVLTACPTGAQTGQAEVVVFGDDGPNFQSSATMAMCNTVVYLGGDTGSSIFQKQRRINGGDCTIDLPCPKTSGNTADAGYLEFTGLVDWTAPNITSGPRPSPRGLEDLLFWSESSGVTNVKSGANLVTQGIFVGPNMTVEFRSPAVGEPRNAQFIARRLKLLQGTLQMLPNPNDSTPIPAPGSFSIIR